ncbi:hypothetical protein Ancab_022885 [Ancistrocladus abbreviatus]
MGSVGVEEDRHRSTSAIPPMSIISNLHIDSLCVDIGEQNVNANRCNHFSIRGYAAEVRKRDRRISSPFCSDDDNNGLVEKTYELPSLKVPEFRYWRCMGCLQRSGFADEVYMMPNGCNNATNCTAPCYHQKSIEGDEPALLLKDSGQTLKIQDGQNHESSTLTDSINNGNCVSLCCHQQGKAVLGSQYCLAENLHQGIMQPTSDVIEVDVLEQARHADDSVFHKRKFSEIVESHLQKHGSEGASEAGLPGRNSNCEDTRILEIHKQRRKCFNGGQHRDLLTNEVAIALDQTINATKGHVIPVPDLNEFNDGNAENAKDMTQIHPCEDYEDDCDSMNQKTRSLSELLGLNANGDQQPAARVNILPPHLPNRSTVSVPQGEAIVNENSNLRLIARKKRKNSNDEGHRPLEIRDSSKRTKKARPLDVDKENGNHRTEISDSESEEDASCNIVSQSAASRPCKHTLERNCELEKKAKKNKVDNQDFSLVSRQKVSPKGNQEKTGPADMQFSVAEGNRSRTDDQLDKSHVMARQTERTCSGMKKKKTQIRKEQTPAFPFKSLDFGECSSTRKNTGFALTNGNRGEMQPVKDVSAETAMNHFPTCHFSIGTNLRPVSPVQNRVHFLSAQQEVIVMDDDDQAVRKGAENKSLGNSSTPHTAKTDAAFMEGTFDVNRERSVCQKSNSKGKQKLIPYAEHGGPPLKDDMESLRMHKGITAEVQRHMRDIDINTIPIDDKVPEPGNSEDIPMDIVELMAKNQHERCSDSGSDKHFALAPNSCPKNPSPVGSGSSSYGVRPLMMSNLRQEYVPVMPRPQASNAMSGMVRGLDDRVSIKQKLLVGHFPEINRTHFNIGHPRETYSTGRFGGSAQHQEHIPNEPRIPSLGLNSQKWNGNTSAQRSPSAFLRGLESFNRSLAACQQNSGTHAWPSGMPNRTHLGIGNSRMLSQCSDKQRVNQCRSLINFNAANAGKQTNLPTSWSTNLTEYSSAMQLLNLMHTGGMRQTTVPYAMDGNLAFSKWPDQRHNQCTGKQGFRAYKTGANSRHQSFESNRQTSSPKEPHPCYSAIPGIRGFTPPFNSGTSLSRSSGFVNSFSFPSREQRNAENSHLSAQGGDFSRPRIPPTPSRQIGRKLSVSALDKGKGIAGATTLSIPQLQIAEDLPNRNQSETQHGVRAALPTSCTEVCILNQNPAEFNDLNLAGKYMIGPEELRRGKGTWERSTKSKAAAKKLEKTLKFPASKIHGRHRKA